ncbi:MAG: adhesin, partial [Arachnia sp.]
MSDPTNETTEVTGLNLFDDISSAAGNFPHAMLGYERQAVDSYIRELETKVAEARVQLRESTRELDFVRTETGTTAFTRLGAHAKAVLQAAATQGAELVRQSVAEAERIKAEARRSAAARREAAQTESDDVRLSGLAALRQLRQEQADVGREVL